MGQILFAQSKIPEAIEYFKAAVESDETHAAFFLDLASALQAAGQFSEAAACYQKALAIQPDSAEAYTRLADLFRRMGNIDSAQRSLRMALRHEPKNLAALTNLGSMLREKGVLDEAILMYEQALSCRPGFPHALNNMALCLAEQGNMAQAESVLKQILASDTILPRIHSNYLLTSLYNPHADYETLAGEHHRYGTLNRVDAPHQLAKLPPTDSPDRTLKIGYVSADLKTHSVAYFLRPLLMNHDRDAFEIHCYANVERKDAVTESFRAMVDGWRDISTLTDEDAARRIAKDKVDVLVDLGGHTSGNRLPLFAHKPAPVQVTYLGYPFTTGMAVIDYRLTDAVCDPDGEERLYTEELVRLPRSFLCYSPLEGAPVRTATPCKAGGFVTFGSFNTLQKINDTVAQTWAALLAQVPGSRLLLKRQSLDNPATRRQVIDRFARFGVTAEQLDIRGHTPRAADHLAHYADVDICLDTFPYNGTTTTCEALWMGVPVVTLTGRHHISRVSTSILTTIGHAELAAQNLQDYIAKAAQLVADHETLEKLSLSLRDAMASSVLCDGPGFTRDVENAFRAMWQRACKP